MNIKGTSTRKRTDGKSPNLLDQVLKTAGISKRASKCLRTSMMTHLIEMISVFWMGEKSVSTFNRLMEIMAGS